MLSGETAISARRRAHRARLRCFRIGRAALPQTCDALAPRRRDRRRPGQPVHEHPAAAARAATSPTAIRASRGDPDPGREPDDRAGRDRRLQRARARADDRAAPRRAAVRLRDLQHQRRFPSTWRRAYRASGAPADRDRHVRAERAREARASSRSACRSCRSTLRARSAITPNGWPSAITALGQGKLGAWRARAEVGRL